MNLEQEILPKTLLILAVVKYLLKKRHSLYLLRNRAKVAITVHKDNAALSPVHFRQKINYKARRERIRSTTWVKCELLRSRKG